MAGERRTSFAKGIDSDGWTNCFSRAESGDDPWFFYMTQDFVERCLDTIYEIIDGVGAYARPLVWDNADPFILREAARSFRSREPQPDRELVGFVRMLKRGEAGLDGTVILLTAIDGKNQSVTTVLKQADYERAVSAHKEQASVVVKGDLERVGQRWSLLNPMIMDVIRNVEPERLSRMP